jgi:uncharacterized protein (DUF58 family)
MLEKLKEYTNLELLAKQMVEGFITGLHKSPYHGFSVEFAEHRLYNTGDSTRHIDWKVYAKTDRLYSKRYEEETNLRCMILLDCSPSMYYPRETGSEETENAKIKFGIVATSCLAYLLQRQRDAVGICTFSDDIELLTQVKSTASHVHSLLAQLDTLLKKKKEDLTGKQTSVAAVIDKIATKIHKRSLVIIFSDMMDNSEKQEELYAALKHLKYMQHEVLLFHVQDKKTETDFDFANRPTLFIDVETGQEEKLNPLQAKQYYVQQTEAKFHEIKLRCGQYKIEFIEVDTAEDIDKILKPYLSKRSRMK